MHSSRTQAALALVALAAASFTFGTQPDDRDALRQIVQQQCMPHWSEHHDPTPCVRVVSPDYAVLADRKGGAHFLLIAARSVTGIEDPAVLDPGSPNYFDAAWQARDRLATVVGHPLPRDAVGLAINSARARTQDQLHIHIECLQPRLRQALRAAAAQLGDHWARLPSAEFPYLALRIRGEQLGSLNPFVLLADGEPGARQDMAAYTIVVAGASLPEGPGFIVLAGRTPRREALLLPRPEGLVAPGETLLDSTCAVDTGVDIVTFQR